MKQYYRSIDALAICLLVSAYLGVAVSYGKLYLFHVVFACASTAMLYNVVRHKQWMALPTRFHLFFVLFALWYILSILWSIERSYTVNYLFYVGTGTALSLFIVFWVSGLSELRLALKTLGWLLCAEVIFSLLEAFTGFRLPVSPFSTISTVFGRPDSLHLFNTTELPSVFITPTGFRWNPNNLGIAMTLALPFTLAHHNKFIRVALSLALFVVVVMTGSRISIAACSMIILLYLLLINWKWFLGGLALYVFVFLMLIFSADTLNKNVYGKKVYEITTLYDATLNMILPEEMQIMRRGKPIALEESTESGVVRRKLMLNGLKAFADTRGLGVGGGASVAVQERCENGSDSKIKSMHNFWIEVLVEGGVPAFVLLLFFYFALLIKLYNNLRKTQTQQHKYLSMAFMLALFAFLFAAVSASTVVYFLPMWLLLGLAVAYVNMLTHEKN